VAGGSTGEPSEILLAIEDFSARGLRVCGETSVPVGSELSIVLVSDGQADLALETRVVRLERRDDERWAMALEVAPSAEVTRRLLELIATPPAS
jgi:hypothetical protein